MTCRRFVELLGEPNRTPREEELLERHVAACPDCLRYLRSYRDTVRLSAAAKHPDTELPEDIARRILTTVMLAARRRLRPDPSG